MLTKNIRTHVIYLNNGEQLRVTKSQYEFIESEVDLKKHNEFIKIYDIDTNELVFNGRCNEIKRFEEKKIDSSYGTTNVVCSYGVKHLITGYPDNCKCKKEFDCLPIVFVSRIKEMGNKIFYSSDITEKMRYNYKFKYGLIEEFYQK